MRIALALLASLRDLDTPDDPEALAESDLPLNLRRRLGLSSVVVDQIRRYEQRRGDVSATEVASLFELIGRRPDATEIFIDAGRRIAREDLDDRGLGPKLALRLMPAGFRRRRAWGRVRKIARHLSPASEVRVEHKRGALVIEHGLPAAAVEGGVGCAVLDGAIEDIFRAYRSSELEVVHTSCEAVDGARCEWQLDTANGGPVESVISDPATGTEAGLAASDSTAPRDLAGVGHGEDARSRPLASG